MNSLFVEETSRTPRVQLHPDGNLSITGRFLLYESNCFFDPILTWIKQLTAPEIHFSIQMEYLNTCGAKYLFIIFQLLKDNDFVKSLDIDWYYEDDDEDAYDIGREFESLINVPFTFHVYAEALG